MPKMFFPLEAALPPFHLTFPLLVPLLMLYLCCFYYYCCRRRRRYRRCRP